MGTLGAESRRGGRGVSAEAFDRRQFKQYHPQGQPIKKPLPMYRKKREPPPIGRYQETDFGGGGAGGGNDAFTPYNRNYYGEVGPHRTVSFCEELGFLTKKLIDSQSELLWQMLYFDRQQFVLLKFW